MLYDIHKRHGPQLWTSPAGIGTKHPYFLDPSLQQHIRDQTDTPPTPGTGPAPFAAVTTGHLAAASQCAGLMGNVLTELTEVLVVGGGGGDVGTAEVAQDNGAWGDVTCKWTGDMTSQWTDDMTCEWTGDVTCEWTGDVMCEWTGDVMCEWMNDVTYVMCEWTNDMTCERMDEGMCEWTSV